jgi:hypothetical protein
VLDAVDAVKSARQSVSRFGVGVAIAIRCATHTVGAGMRILPPYSPDFSPIEAFTKLKALTRKTAARTKEALWNKDGESLAAFTPVKWNHSYNWLSPRCEIGPDKPIFRSGLSENNLLRLHIKAHWCEPLQRRTGSRRADHATWLTIARLFHRCLRWPDFCSCLPITIRRYNFKLEFIFRYNFRLYWLQ